MKGSHNVDQRPGYKHVKNLPVSTPTTDVNKSASVVPLAPEMDVVPPVVSGFFLSAGFVPGVRSAPLVGTFPVVNVAAFMLLSIV